MTGLLTRRFRLGTLVLGATVLALMIGIFILGGGRAAASHVLCGDVLVADTTLDSDLLLCPDDGLVIGADGITVDLDGFTISGDDGAVGDFGIDNTGGFDSVTIKDGEITAFEHGVKAIGADDLTLRDLDVHDIGPGGGDSHAIDILDSDGFTIKDSTIDQSAAPFSAEAIRLESVSDVLVRGVSILGGFVGVNFACDGTCLGLEAPTNGVIRNNTIVGTTDNGILIANSTDATVYRNTISGAGFAGIQVGFRTTTPAATGPGPDAVGVRGVTVSRNKVSGTIGDGILVFRGAHDNTISRNTITGSTSDGLRLLADDNTVAKNKSNENGADGLNVAGDGNTITKNKTDKNVGDGIEIDGDTNTVDKNKAKRNGGDGINVDGDGNTITKNKSNRNGADGINVDGAGNTITSNKTDRNGDNGLEEAGTNTCSQTGPDKNRAKNNVFADFVGCP